MRTKNQRSGGEVLKAKVRGAAEVIMQNRKPGSNPQYHEGFVHLVACTALVGFTLNQVCELLGASQPRVSEWLKKYPELGLAIKHGRDRADEEVVVSLRQRAMGFEHPSEKIFCTKDGEIIRARTTTKYPPDTSAAFILLKNRQGWRDQPDAQGPTADDAKRILREEMKELDDSVPTTP